MAKWHNIFKDENDWNEKTIIGGIAFAFIIIYSLLVIIGNMMGYKIEFISEIFNSLVTITLGSFGIAEVSKTAERWQKNRRYPKPMEREREISDDPHEKDDYLETE